MSATTALLVDTDDGGNGSDHLSKAGIIVISVIFGSIALLITVVMVSCLTYDSCYKLYYKRKLTSGMRSFQERKKIISARVGTFLHQRPDILRMDDIKAFKEFSRSFPDIDDQQVLMNMIAEARLKNYDLLLV